MSDFVVNGKHLKFLARPAARSKRRFASVRLLGKFRAKGSSNAAVRTALKADREKDR